MESFIFTILIWILLIPQLLTDNTKIKLIICIIQIILLIAQLVYMYFKLKK